MEDADHHACIVFSHVINRERPVLLVARDAGYPPQFMSGADDHHGHKDGRIVGYGCLLENDPTLREVGTVLEGHEYERDEVGGVWTRRAAASEGSGASVCGRT